MNDFKYQVTVSNRGFVHEGDNYKTACSAFAECKRAWPDETVSIFGPGGDIVKEHLPTLVFLLIGHEHFADVKPFFSKAAAIADYREYLDQCDRFGNTPDAACIHISSDYENVQDYPDYILEPGPRGGVKVEVA